MFASGEVDLIAQRPPSVPRPNRSTGLYGLTFTLAKSSRQEKISVWSICLPP